MNPAVERAIGRLLRPLRASERHLAWNDPRLAEAPPDIRLTSAAFADGGAIPLRHAGAGVGANLSPPLGWSGVPHHTAELALIVQDPDAPLLRPVVHLIALGLPPGRDGLEEGELAPDKSGGIRFGRGSFRRIGYAGPRPVRGHGPHRYVFQIVALVRPLPVPSEPDLAATLAAMAGIVSARGRLTGTFERS
ncbi:YbhB/YbcL family Raf kinase inhibitor-like protein [Bosea sp. BK604]|uniref:YbhB/YbcL family Raf kinase inhibitor-like protein n=1 Tax=Bosea sp. BK604 TaxID=2512180 RepID=UPI0010EA5BD9|nr:YbhB/YbcL family Raf kinase inhibitor-like protein [Bosea sp. BK604]TCR66262.1 hypothetical protein EV560_104140 [Bosea sp. BK604]